MGTAQHNTHDTTPPMQNAPAPAEVLALGELEVFPGAGLARVSGRPLMLSVREFGVLVALLRRAGRVVSREELYGEVWGASLRADDRSVDVYVHKLRVKLDAVLPGRPLIHTHFGFGYRV
jgi:DNA-binding response OmpR family regulator